VVTDKFDELLAAMPTVAEAVNKFESAQVQELAFQALIRALEIGETAANSTSARVQHVPGSQAKELDNAGNGAPPANRRKRRRGSVAAVSADRSIDFRPSGKPSLREFVADKRPTSNPQRNVVAVYYLEQVLSLPSVSAGQVLAVYKECGWREPGSILNSLRVTASTKNWLDTSDSAAIRTTPSGRGVVEHDMPLSS
jgi:hypothetical protein